jgi:hypothetical protein
MNKPAPRTALKATGMRRRYARCLETELAALTAERDHWQKIAVSASHEREHNANVAQAMTAERDQLRAHVSKAILTNGGTMLCSPQVAVKYNEAIARAESAEREAFDWKKIARYETARAERAEREVQRLKSDGAASAFVNMSCRASRAETDRNNLRADKARLDWLEKARPIAWALGSEECGEYWILTDTGEKHPEEAEEFATLRAAIDAAMKEGA